MSTVLKSDDIVIVSAQRTPMGGFQGAFSTLSATELGGIAIKDALAKASVDTAIVDEVMMGNVLSAGLGQAPARQAALNAELTLGTMCTTISKVCGSGLRAVMLAHDQLHAGNGDIIVAGGMESMTNAPYFIAKARGGFRLGHGEIKDHMFFDGLEDAYTGRAMGSFAQETADQRGITREQMDGFAIESLNRAKQAISNGSFNNEISPVSVKTRNGLIEITTDEQPGNANVDKIPSLKPAFAKDGTITPANSSSISDGAAALVLMKASKASELGLKPIAKIAGHAGHAQHPSEFTLAPIGSINKLLAKLGWHKDDIDLWEINEAFAMVTMLAMQGLELDHSKVNINGGACALGHPIGASGARILVTLIHALKNRGLSKGIASLCIGGGEATSLAVEII